MDNIKQSHNKIEFTSHVSWATRAFIMIMGLFCWLAPYELLTKPSCGGRINWIMAFFLFISLGAAALGAVAIYTALFALNKSIQINSTSRIITYGYKPGVLRFRQKHYSFAEIEMVQPIIHSWTDGPPKYYIGLKAIGQREIEFGGFAGKEEAEKYLSILKEMIMK